MEKFGHGTTIIGVRKNWEGRGRRRTGRCMRVACNRRLIKPNAKKVRRLGDGKVIGGCARHRR